MKFNTVCSSLKCDDRQLILNSVIQRGPRRSVRRKAIQFQHTSNVGMANHTSGISAYLLTYLLILILYSSNESQRDALFLKFI
jgi:hypothetical protein